MTSALLVTGLPRSGTSWAGKMLELSGQVVYINEPMNPRRPPGRSPGVLNASVIHRFEYIDPHDDDAFATAFSDTLRLRYKPLAEARAVRNPYDAARMAKYALSFSLGRLLARRPLLDDPYALLSAQWLVNRMGVRALVLVRDPVSLIGSWRQLGWHIDLDDLLQQPALVRDHLNPHMDVLRAARDSGSWIRQMCALWNVSYAIMHDVATTTPDITIRRYEDLASSPVEQFAALYSWFDLDLTEATRQLISDINSSDNRSERGFSWSLRGGISRTAFRPMDSRSAVARQQSRLDENETRLVRSLTDEVHAKFPRAAS